MRPAGRVDRVGLEERADPGPDQDLDQAAAAQGLADVPGDRADIRPAPAIDLQLQPGPGVRDQLDPVDPDRPGRQLDRLAGAGQVVSPLALDLQGRELRGDLLDRPDLRRQRRADLRLGRNPRRPPRLRSARRRRACRSGPPAGRPSGRSWASAGRTRSAGSPRPTQTTRTPEASGSSVPACPTLTFRSGREIEVTTSREVIPPGLSRFSTPD